MIGSPLNSLTPGPTPAQPRSPSGSGTAGAGSGAGSREPNFADHLREASDPASTEPSTESSASVLPRDFTAQRDGREFSRPISFDAVGPQPGQAGQSDQPAQPGQPAGAAGSTGEVGAEGLVGGMTDAGATQPVPVVPAAATAPVPATIITGAGNPASTVFNPGRNPAHAAQPAAGAAAAPAGISEGAAVTAGAAAGPPTGSATFPSAHPSAVSTPGAGSLPATSATAQATSATTPGAPAVPMAPGAGAPVAAPAASAESAAPAPAVRAWTVQQLSTPVVQAAGRAVSLPDGTHLATVKISPEALGPVTLEATSRDGSIRLEITAATEAGRDNLRVVLNELRRELAAAQPGATLELSSGAKENPAQGSGPGPGGRPGEGKDQAGADVGHPEHGTTGPGAEGTETGPERQPGGHGTNEDGTGGLDVYA